MAIHRRLCIMAALCGWLAACGDRSASVPSPLGAAPAAPVASAPPVPASVPVTLIMKTLTNPFFIEMEKGARRARTELGVDLRVRTATQETSIDQQIQLVGQAVEEGIRAIVIAPGDSTLLVPALKKAQDAGVVVVNIDNRLNPQAVQDADMAPVPFISVDNEKAAFEVARAVTEGIRQPTQVAILEGIPTADNAQQRLRGALKAFALNPQLRVVASETAHWKIDEAYTVIQNILKAHPGVGVVFCANDMMALGVARYLQETGRSQVKVIGYDALQEAQSAIRAGHLVATVDQKADLQGYQGVRLAVDRVRGHEVPALTLVSPQVLQAADLR